MAAFTYYEILFMLAMAMAALMREDQYFATAYNDTLNEIRDKFKLWGRESPVNFACPLNSVSNKVQRDFFRCNPEVANAWDIDIRQ